MSEMSKVKYVTYYGDYAPNSLFYIGNTGKLDVDLVI